MSGSRIAARSAAAGKQAYGVRTNREAINLALHDTVMRQRQLEVIETIAAIELDASVEKITYGP